MQKNEISTNTLRVEAEDGENSASQEDLHHAKAKTRKHPSGNAGALNKNQRRYGRKRKARSMGRYPGLTYTKKYIAAVSPYLAKGKEGTVGEIERKLRHIFRVLRELKVRGLVATDNPKKLSESDIRAYVRFQQDRGLCPRTICKHISILNGFTVWLGNSVIAKMRALPDRSGLPKAGTYGARNSFSEETMTHFLETALNHTRAMNEWWNIASFGFASLYTAFGLRPKELRYARFGDLELHNWRLCVSHPKGRGQWAGRDYAIALPPFRRFVQVYLTMRLDYLTDRGIDPWETSVPLMPRIQPPKGKNVDPIHFNSDDVRIMFRELQKLSGIPIKPKDCRTSYGQIAKDHGIPLEECSTLLRHTNVKTTQAFYISLRPENAYKALDRYFDVEEPAVHSLPKYKNAQIEI